MRFLISRLSALGDVVCTLPVAAALKTTWPGCDITWICDKRFRGILDCCTSVDTIVERPRTPGEVRNLEKFDIAFDMQGLFKSGVLVGSVKAKQKLGYHWQREFSNLFSQRVIPDPTSLHIVDQYVDVARAAGANVDAAEFNLAPMPDDIAKIDNLLVSKGWQQEKLIVCNAGAGWVTKRWNPTKYADLVNLSHESNVQICFLGSPGDQEAFAEINNLAGGRAINMVGETNIRELVSLVSLATVVVGGDTGSTHIAAALGRPTIGIYTITNPIRSCPYGQYENCFQGDPTVEEVWEKVVQFV